MGNLVVEGFVLEYTLPQMIDIEMAQRIILDEFGIHSPASLMKSEDFVHLVRRQLFAQTGPTYEGFSFDPNLHEVKAIITTFEALQSLHANGALIGAGSLLERNWSVRYISPRGDSVSFITPLPGVYMYYRVAAAFQGKNSRLASGDVYLSHLNLALLPSRAKRCLKEAVDAFRHGLYLSATMNVGAATECLWMDLGRLVDQKTFSTTKLKREVTLRYPSIGTIMDESWQALISHASDIPDEVVGKEPDRSIFKLYADRLRDWRNYAMHNTDADEDEPRFTYSETGLLLLDAANHINKLALLVEKMRQK